MYEATKTEDFINILSLGTKGSGASINQHLYFLKLIVPIDRGEGEETGAC